VPLVDLGPASAAVAPELLSRLAELIEAGAFVNGPQVEAFERDFAAFCGRTTTVGVASGLDALRLSLLASGLTEGSEVVVPAMTFVATLEAVVQAGGKPVVVDIRDDDLGMDPEAAAAAAGTRTQFLLPVHLHGQMADVRGLARVATRQSLELIEDACQAHGASRDGIDAGAAGIAGCFSFYPSKNLGAMGDAGAIVLDDAALDRKARSLREHGQSRRYHSDDIGYTARLDAIQALVLSLKLPLLEGWNAERRNAAAYYLDALSGVGDLRLPQEVPGATHVWHVFAVRTAAPDALAEFLASRGVSTGRHYPVPVHLLGAFENLGLRAGAFPVAEAVARETLSLPLFPGISEAQLEAVADGVRAYFAGG